MNTHASSIRKTIRRVNVAPKLAVKITQKQKDGLLLRSINASFNADLKKHIDGSLPKNHVYKLGMPSKALLYAGVQDLPIEMSAGTIEAKSSKDYVHDHPFGLVAIFNLPTAIQKPIAVFDTEEPMVNRKIILTEIKLAGNNFIAVLDLRKLSRGGRYVNSVNSIVSLYAKDSSVRIAKWFDSTNKRGLELDRELCRWADTKKASAWLSSHSSDVNAAGLSAKRIANVIQKFNTVQF